MSIIRIPLLFSGSKGEKVLYTLFNSGATFSCTTAENADLIGLVDKLHRPLNVDTACNGHYLKIENRISTDFYFEDLRLSDEFMIVPGLSEEAIIGVNTMQKWRIKLDYEHDTVIIDPKVAKLILTNLKAAS